MKRKLLSMALVLAFAFSFFNGPALERNIATAAGNEIVVEGENSFKTSITCSTQSANSLSGGKALMVQRSAANVPKDGCTILYKVQVDYDGAFYMYITCPTIGADWISPCEIRINDEPYQRLTEMKYEQVGTLNGTGVADNLYNQYKLKSVNLKKGINNIYVRIPSARQMDGQMYFYLDCLKFVPAPWGLNGFETGVPTNVYEEKDEVKPVINFSFSDPETHKLTYRVANYFDETVLEETVDIVNTNQYELNFQEPLPVGHYTVHVSVDDAEPVEYYFSIVKNYEERDVESNTHFMVDAAGIYLIDSTKIEDYARSMRLAGITSARERFRWTTYQTDSETIDMSAFEVYQKAYEENGIHTLALNESAPGFMRSESHVFPQDLVEAYKFAKYMTERYGDKVSIEAWNEPDTKDEPADYLAAYVKAMAIGQKDAQADSLAVGPGLCVSPGLYTDTFLQNEVMEYLDVWSFHSHTSGANTNTKTRDIPGIMSLFMDTIKNYGYDGNKYYYLTEAGINALPDPDIPAERQKVQTRYLATSMLQVAQLGTDRHYWFVYPYYKEGDLWWGSFTQDDMPYSVYSALAALTDVMGEAKYIGELDLAEGVNCLVFEDKGNHVLGIWSENETDVQVQTSQGEAQLVNIMGNAETITAENGAFAITSGPDMQYLKLEGKVDAFKDAVYQEKEVEPTSFTKAQRVILQQNYPADTVPGSKSGGYILPTDQTTTVTVNVTNLNDTAMSGTVTGKIFEGWTMTPASQNVTVEPYSVQSLTFEISATESALPGVSVPVVFEGTFGGERTSRTVTTIVAPADDNVETSYLLNGYDDPANWQKNMTEGGTEERVAEGNGVLDIHYVFQDGDKWVYPRFDLQGDNLKGTAGLVYEVYFDEVPEGLRLRAFAYEKNGSAYFTDAATSSDQLKKGWNRIVIPYSKFVWQGGLTDFNFNLDPEEITAISLGLNSATERDIHYKIRNVGVYEQPEVAIYASIDSFDAAVAGNTVTFSAELSENQTGIQQDTIRLLVDDVQIEAAYADGKVTATYQAEPGTHEAKLIFTDGIGKAIFSTCSFEIR